MGKSTCQNWSTWMELSIDYNESKKKVRGYRQQLREQGEERTSERAVHLELAGSMENDLSQITEELEKRLLYQLGTLDEKEIEAVGLTERQKEITLLRQRYSYTEIGKKLGMNAHAVFYSYQAVINKIRKYKMAEIQGQPYGLSKQQLVIYKLHKEGKSRSEIADFLKMNVNGVGVQLRRIEQKLEKNKTTEN